MKRWVAVAAGCAAVAAVALWFTFFRDSEETRVRRVLDELARTVAVKEGDTLLSRTARLRGQLPALVDDDVRVNVAELGLDLRGRARLEQDAARAGLLYQQASVDLTNVSLRIDPQGTLAQVDAVALVTANRGGERQVDRRDVHLLLRRDDGWKITTIDVAPRKPD